MGFSSFCSACVRVHVRSSIHDLSQVHRSKNADEGWFFFFLSLSPLVCVCVYVHACILWNEEEQHTAVYVARLAVEFFTLQL